MVVVKKHICHESEHGIENGIAIGSPQSVPLKHSFIAGCGKFFDLQQHIPILHEERLAEGGDQYIIYGVQGNECDYDTENDHYRIEDTLSHSDDLPCFLLFPAISLPPYHNALSEIFLLNLFARITMINATTDSKSPAATDSP